MMTSKNLSTRVKIIVLIFSVLLLGIISQNNFTVSGQAQRGSITVTVSDNDGIIVGMSVQFQVQVNEQSDAACDDGEWILDFGDGRSTSGSSSTTRSHTYLKAGAYNAVVSYTYFKNMGTGAPDCQPQTDSDSVAVIVNEAEMPDPTEPSDTIRFVGSSNNWFDPNNWSTGTVPGENDSVLIDGDAQVVINPEQDSRPESGILIMLELHLAGNARLETRPGTELSMTRLNMDEFATFFLQSSVLNAANATLRSQINPPVSLSNRGRSAALPWGCTWCGLSGNPSSININNLEVEQIGLLFYLGGPEPAMSDALGEGFYANIRAKTVSIADSTLAQELIYDFEPEVGDRFVIIEATESIVGGFENYAEGSVVAQNGEVDLVIHYTTNQIVLAADESQN